MMAIEKIENTETARTSPPKKGNLSVKDQVKRTTICASKEDEEEYSKEELWRLELNFNRVKISNQPKKKILKTDFLNSISKNTCVPCLEKPPDPNVIDALRGHVE